MDQFHEVCATTKRTAETVATTAETAAIAVATTAETAAVSACTFVKATAIATWHVLLSGTVAPPRTASKYQARRPI